MITLVLSQQEGNALLQLLDIAVKSAGLQVAEAGIVLAKRVSQAQQEANTTTPPVAVQAEDVQAA